MTKPNQRKRAWATILLAFFATVATSQALGTPIAASEEKTAEPGQSLHFRLLLSEAAVEETFDFRASVRVTIDCDASADSTLCDQYDKPMVQLIPDDDALPLAEVNPSSVNDTQLEWFISLNGLEACAPGEACELGFSLFLYDDTEYTATVSASMHPPGNSSLCFPGEVEYTADATLEIVFD